MIELNNISYVTPTGKHLLNGITASIPHGCRIAIMGLNGAGKTTLLKVMSRYLKPSSGSICVANRAITEFSVRELARELAHVPQDFPTEFPFTVGEFVRMGRYAWQDAPITANSNDSLTRTVLNRLNLADFENRFIGTLSGGERQRTLVARALVQDAPVLLLDEPLNHLDIKQRAFCLKILKEENEARKRTIIAVMHDLDDVRCHFTHVLFLKSGKSVFCGDITHAFTPEILREVFEMDFDRDARVMSS